MKMEECRISEGMMGLGGDYAFGSLKAYIQIIIFKTPFFSFLYHIKGELTAVLFGL